MGYNIYQGQITGPFVSNTDLFTKIKEDCESSSIIIWHLGIQTDPENRFEINNEIIKVGKTGIYEIGNTRITQFETLQDLDANTIIDYVIQK